MDKGVYMFIVNQNRDAVFDTCNIEGVKIVQNNNENRIIIKTLDGKEVTIANYTKDFAASKVFENLKGALGGIYEMPTEEESMNLMDAVFVCRECQAKNKIPFETLYNLSKAQMFSFSPVSDTKFYCSACGTIHSASEVIKK